MPKSHHSDTQSVQLETDNLIKTLVEKYSGNAKSDEEEHDDPDEQVVPDDYMGGGGDADEKRAEPGKKKRIAAEKQKKHLENTRQLALDQRKEYAAQRKKEKEEVEKAAYEAEFKRRANEELKQRLHTAMKQKQDEWKKKVASLPKKTRKPARYDKDMASARYEQDMPGLESSTDEDELVDDYETSSDEEEAVVTKKWVCLRKATPVPKLKQVKKVVARKKTKQDDHPPSPTFSGFWDDYCLWVTRWGLQQNFNS